MSVTLGQLTRPIITPVVFYDQSSQPDKDLEVIIKITHKRVKPDLMNELEENVELEYQKALADYVSGNIEDAPALPKPGVIKFLAVLITDWDIMKTKEEKLVVPDTETKEGLEEFEKILGKLPTHILVAMRDAILETTIPKKKPSKTSSGGTKQKVSTDKNPID